MFWLNDTFFFQLSDCFLDLIDVLGDDSIRFIFYWLEEYFEHAFYVLGVCCFEEKEGEETGLHVPVDAHKCSYMPFIELVAIWDSKKAALSIFLIIFLHEVIDNDDRIGDDFALSFHSVMHWICHDGVSLIF